MPKYYISINQLAEFAEATDSSKKRILKQQKTPNKFLVPWYQRAKGAMKKYFSNVKNYAPIDNAITLLREKKSENNRQRIDQAVSIQALELIKKISLPKSLLKLDYELITVDEREISIDDVDIKVAPEIIIKAKLNNEVVYGAIKIHISKGKPFNLNQATYVSTLIYQFLIRKVAKKNEKVLPELCLCLDVFSERLVPAPINLQNGIMTIRKICEEVKVLW